MASGRCLAASVCRHARWVGMLYCWLVHSTATFPCWLWFFCPLWGSPHFLRGFHGGLLELWLGWRRGRRGCVARRSRRLSGVAFGHGQRPWPASRACGLRGVSRDGGVCRVWVGPGWGPGHREMTVLRAVPPARLVGAGAAGTPVRLVPGPAGGLPGPLCWTSPEPGDWGSRWGCGRGGARCRRAGCWWCQSG